MAGRGRFKCGAIAFAIALAWLAPSQANDAPPRAPIFRDPTFEELGNVTVTSVARKEQTFFQTPAAIYVISSEDIRRSGARNLPEALRLAPGVEVARISPHRYAVGIRGFNRELSNKLLVLQDGRYIYTPLFAGTYWDTQDTRLDDIERIEVVRGPGGTAWGANAVNGVISIVTKHANDTRGLALNVGGGDEERWFGNVRYGADFAGAGAYRVFLQAAERDEAVFANGLPADNGWRQARGGFRIDTPLSAHDVLSMHGEVFSGDAHEIALGAPSEIDVRGAYVLGRWERKTAAGDDLSAQMYYGDSKRETFQSDSERSDWAVEIINRMRVFARHDLTYGLHYRQSRNAATTMAGLSFTPPTRTLAYAGAFVDDAVRFFADRLTFSVGLKAEYNDFTQTEWLPNMRLLWQPSAHQAWWTAISRGARLPSISDNDATVASPGLLSLPNTESPAERVHAYEAGWRAHARERWSFDVAAYYNDYDQLRTRETSFVPSPPTVVRMRDAKLQADTHGVETVVALQATAIWRLQLNASYYDETLRLDADSTDRMIPDDVGLSPAWQASLRSSLRIGQAWDLHVLYRYVDDLMRTPVPGYDELDIRIAWQIAPRWQVAVTGQNLLHDHHLEIPGQTGQAPGSDVERGAYLQVRWEH